jgi:ribosomal protein S18 acetylase RimI-like enzyme
MTDLHCTALTPARLDDYLRFFDTRAFTDNPRWSGCYCYFPLHNPQTTDWHARSAAQNRAAVSSCIAAREARGFLAYRGAEVVGWCNAGPWSQYPMLSDEPETDSETLGVIFCFVIEPASRGQGIARALLLAACDGLRSEGMTAVQARPLKDAQSPADNHLGPLAMYLKAGFEAVRESTDGAVLVRKSLR